MIVNTKRYDINEEMHNKLYCEAIKFITLCDLSRNLNALIHPEII